MLSDKPIQERVRLAEQLRGFSRQIAEEVTEEFLVQHPDWVTRYGGRGRRLGIEDAIYHQDFLAAAIEIGEVSAFGDYLRWTAGVLGSREIASSSLREYVELISRGLWSRLPAPTATEVAEFVQFALDQALAGLKGRRSRTRTIHHSANRQRWVS